MPPPSDNSIAVGSSSTSSSSSSSSSSSISSKRVKWSLHGSGVAQRVGRGIALLFHVRDTRRGWGVSSTPRPHFIPGKDPVPILQEAGWAPAPVWTGGKSRPHGDSIPDRPARSQSLYRLSYPAHLVKGTAFILSDNYDLPLPVGSYHDPLNRLPTNQADSGGKWQTLLVK